MADPYERLLDAPERGWKSGKSKGTVLEKKHELSSSLAADLIPRYRRFILTAEPRSSRPGLRGQQIQAEMWYFPVPPIIIKTGGNHIQRYTTRSGEVHEYPGIRKNDSVGRQVGRLGEDLRRVVTRPRLEAERFIAHDAASRTIGFSQMRQATMHPISTPMRD
jgi:hypothetical protein